MWSNWAGNRMSPLQVTQPGSEEALRTLVQSADTLRCVGSGHSFTPLIEGASQLVDLSRLDTPVVREVDGTTAWVNANASLKSLSEGLSGHELAFPNLGDINVQTLAGATATATHGTGKPFPCLSAQILDARVMLADGTVITISEEETEVLQAIQVSLGTLGILLEVKLDLAPKFNLRRRTRMVTIEEGIAQMDALWDQHRCFEFYYLPFTGKLFQIILDETADPETKAPSSMDEFGLSLLKLFRNAGRISAGLRKSLLKIVEMVHSDEDYVGESWKVLCSTRNTRFIETEYHLPPENAADALREVMRCIETKHPETYFPIEVRQTAGDDAWLSPFQGGNRISIAVHSIAKEAHPAFFEDMEAIFKNAGGRPHWGKMHTLNAGNLAQLYPDFEKFTSLREKLDPTGKFLTPAMRNLLVAE